MSSAPDPPVSSRQRVTAAERRDALIDAAIEEFAVTGLHGTPVERIARRVGVAQPYVFSLFQTKRELFIAAVERCFERVGDAFTQAAQEALSASRAGRRDGERDASTGAAGDHGAQGDPVLQAVANSYCEMLRSDRAMLMLQLQSYAACDDEVIREHVRDSYEALRHRIKVLANCDDEELHRFMSSGLYLTTQAAMGATDRLEALAEELRTAWHEGPQVKG